MLVLSHTLFLLFNKQQNNNNYQKIRFGIFRLFCLLLFFLSFFLSFVFFLVNFTDTFFTLDVYLGHGDAVRVVDPELGKLERKNVGHEISHGISLNTPILGTTSTSTRRHTRRESKDGNMMFVDPYFLVSFKFSNVLFFNPIVSSRSINF